MQYKNQEQENRRTTGENFEEKKIKYKERLKLNKKIERKKNLEAAHNQF